MKPDVSLFYILQIDTGNGSLLTLKLVTLTIWQRFPKQAREELTSPKKKRESAHSAISERQVVVWEDAWVRHRDIVKSRISALLGISERIPARLTQVRRIDKATAAAFLDNNHLQGNVLSRTQYGLFLPEKYYRVLSPAALAKATEYEWLVAVSTFSPARVFYRNDKPYRSFELIRFANVLNTTIVGGLARLIKVFSRDFLPGDIMTYADLEWSDGKSYRQLGFEAISDISPVDFWLDTETLVRSSTRKPDMDLQNKILISNAGSRKFVLSLQDQQTR